jgi:hypothetical protein
MPSGVVYGSTTVAPGWSDGGNRPSRACTDGVRAPVRVSSCGVFEFCAVADYARTTRRASAIRARLHHGSRQRQRIRDCPISLAGGPPLIDPRVKTNGDRHVAWRYHGFHCASRRHTTTVRSFPGFVPQDHDTPSYTVRSPPKSCSGSQVNQVSKHVDDSTWSL